MGIGVVIKFLSAGRFIGKLFGGDGKVSKKDIKKEVKEAIKEEKKSKKKK